HKIDMACRDVLRCGVCSHAGEGGDSLSHQPLEEVNARLTLQAMFMLTGITLRHGHTSAATVSTITVEENLQGNPEQTLMGLIEKGTGAIASSLRITEHRFHTGSVLVDPPSQSLRVVQEQQRQPREHGMHQGMPRCVPRVWHRRKRLCLAQPHALRHKLTLMSRQDVHAAAFPCTRINTLVGCQCFSIDTGA